MTILCSCFFLPFNTGTPISAHEKTIKKALKKKDVRDLFLFLLLFLFEQRRTGISFAN